MRSARTKVPKVSHYISFYFSKTRPVTHCEQSMTPENGIWSHNVWLVFELRTSVLWGDTPYHCALQLYEGWQNIRITKLWLRPTEWTGIQFDRQHFINSFIIPAFGGLNTGKLKIAMTGEELNTPTPSLSPSSTHTTLPLYARLHKKYEHLNLNVVSYFPATY